MKLWQYSGSISLLVAGFFLENPFLLFPEGVGFKGRFQGRTPSWSLYTAVIHFMTFFYIS